MAKHHEYVVKRNFCIGREFRLDGYKVDSSSKTAGGSTQTQTVTMMPFVQWFIYSTKYVSYVVLKHKGGKATGPASGHRVLSWSGVEGTQLTEAFSFWPHSILFVVTQTYHLYCVCLFKSRDWALGRKSPWNRKWPPLQRYCLGNSTDGGAWWATHSPQGPRVRGDRATGQTLTHSVRKRERKSSVLHIFKR